MDTSKEDLLKLTPAQWEARFARQRREHITKNGSSSAPVLDQLAIHGSTSPHMPLANNHLKSIVKKLSPINKVLIGSAIAGAAVGPVSVVGGAVLALTAVPVAGAVSTWKTYKKGNLAGRLFKSTLGTALSFVAFVVPFSLTSPTPEVVNTPKSEPNKVVTQPAYTRWNNPNVKPFDVSPYYQGGYTPTVYWDASTNQWYCKVSKHSATRCQDAEGKTEEQLAESRYQSEKFMADRDAQERALNDYWCGPFEDPKKTGCNKL